MSAEQIAIFLEASYGAFQQELRFGRWNWQHDQLIAAVTNLAQHGLIEAHADGRYELTPLGRLAGESGVEVLSIIRLVDCLRRTRSEQITDPALVTAVQATVELDQVYIHLNKKTPKEGQSWLPALAHQGVPQSILGSLARDMKEASDQAARAKRAVAALAYVSGEEISVIERMLARHGGVFDGAAGPVRSIASRTADLLGTAARVAELLHPELQFGDRIDRLTLRLTLGISSHAVGLARHAGINLTRGDYRRLVAAELVEPEAVLAATDEQLLTCLDQDRFRLALVKAAATAAVADQIATEAESIELAPYVA